MKTRLSFSLLCLFVLLFPMACQTEKEKDQEVPQTLISEPEFKKILVEMHLTEALAANYPIVSDSLASSTLSAYEYIFEKYGVSKKTFRENLHYYVLDTEKMSLIMEEVIDSLTLLYAGFD